MQRSQEMKHRQAAILILVDQNYNVLLTERAKHLSRSPGVICLPGGMVEQNETIQGAALREAYEEVELDTLKITVIDTVHPVITDDLVIAPVIALYPHGNLRDLQLVPNQEVSKIIIANLDNAINGSVQTGTITKHILTKSKNRIDIMLHNYQEIIQSKDQSL